MSNIPKDQADAIASKVIDSVVGQTLKFSGGPLGANEPDFREKVSEAIAKAISGYDVPNPATDIGLPKLTPALHEVKVASPDGGAAQGQPNVNVPIDTKSGEKAKKS